MQNVLHKGLVNVRFFYCIDDINIGVGDALIYMLQRARAHLDACAASVRMLQHHPARAARGEDEDHGAGVGTSLLGLRLSDAKTTVCPPTELCLWQGPE